MQHFASLFHVVSKVNFRRQITSPIESVLLQTVLPHSALCHNIEITPYKFMCSSNLRLSSLCRIYACESSLSKDIGATNTTLLLSICDAFPVLNVPISFVPRLFFLLFTYSDNIELIDNNCMFTIFIE